MPNATVKQKVCVQTKQESTGHHPLPPKSLLKRT